jgi:hypothetical protein
MDQLREFIAGRRLDPPQPRGSPDPVDVGPIEEQHVEVDIQVQGTAEALDQRDGAGACRLQATPAWREKPACRLTSSFGLVSLVLAGKVCNVSAFLRGRLVRRSGQTPTGK